MDRLQDRFYNTSEPDFLGLLRHLIYLKKEKSPSFSLRSLAKKAKLSPSLLSLVMVGKRKLSLAAAESLASAFCLRGKQRRYFLTLAQLHSARTAEEKWKLQNELMKLQGSEAEQALELRHYRLISHWYYSVLYVLCGLKNLDHSTASLHQRLGPEVSIKEVQVALNDLISLGLIKKTGERYEQILGSVSTQPKMKDAAIYKYHHDMLKRAELALKRSSSEREFEGLTVAIPKKQMKVVKEKIRSFMTELNLMLDQHSEADDVYQLNLQLFPLTQKNISSKGDEND